MDFYKKHVFMCTNKSQSSKQSCYYVGAYDLYLYAKNQSKILNLKRQGIRISSSGCLGRCCKGPVLVVYPKAIWYSYKNKSDIDEILASLLDKEGSLVETLLVKD
jgi:(2Fe-2S) ferredoxin